MRIVGIDPSVTSAGVVAVDPLSDNLIHLAIGTKPVFGTVWERYSHSIRTLRDQLRPGDAVFMEDYAFGIRGKQSQLATMGEIGGLFKMTCLQIAGCWPFPVSTTSVKKFICGVGTGVKMEDLKLALYKKSGLEFGTGDEVIAFGVAEIGLCALGWDPRGRASGWFGYELDVVEKLRKGWALLGRLEDLQTFAKNFKKTRENV
jgi:hypothetical protein